MYHRSAKLTLIQAAGASLAVLVLALVLDGSLHGANAQSICVACDRPQGDYKCNLDRGTVDRPLGKHAKRLMRLACIQDIAKRYGHEVCRVRRGAVGPCTGENHTISLRAPPTNAPSSPYQPQTAKPDAPPDEPARTKPQKSKKQPPDTMVELAEKAGKDSRNQLRKASKAVGRAVRKTWRCVTSLFGDC